MVILGLGSNVGDRLSHLRKSLALLKKIPTLTVLQVSPIYVSDALLPDDAPASWDMPYFNLALRCEISLKPHELLRHTKEIEIILGREPGKNWGPRPVDIDILAWDEMIIHDEKLEIPHKHLHERPFALWPLADVAPRWVYPLQNAFYGKTAAEIAASWGSRFTGDAPLHTKQILQRIDTPQLVGILNITPDSFSDGGKTLDPTLALQQAYRLLEGGAEIIDVGAEASGPTATLITPEVEWQRLEPVLTNLLNETSRMPLTPKISVDTRHADVAKKALVLGVDWINDVSGLADPAMVELIAAHKADVVIMHNLGVPANSDNILPPTENPVMAVYAWAEKKIQACEKAGVSPEQIIFDIGIGFGKNAEQSLELLKNIDYFHSLNTRLLVGHSRKSFLKLFTNLSAAERDVETLPISLFLAQHNVDYLRLHNPEICARAFKVASAFSEEN